MALASQTIRQQGSVRAFSADGVAGRRRRRRQHVTWAVGLLVLLLGGLAVYAWWPSGDQPPQAKTAAATTSDTTGDARGGGAPTRSDIAAINSKPGTAAAPTTLTMGRQSTLSGTSRSESALSEAIRSAPGQPSGATKPPATAATSGNPGGTSGGHAPAPTSPIPTQTDGASPSQPASTAQPADLQPSFPSPAVEPAAYSPIRATLDQAAAFASQNRPVQARSAFNRALQDPRAGDIDRDTIRRRLAELSQTLTFSPAIVEGDPLAQKYTIQPGDSLVRIAANQKLGVDWRFLQRINRMSDPGRLSVGQVIKVVRGPFHAVVSKSLFRLDLYQGAPPNLPGASGPGAGAAPQGDNCTYICSFPVGLGEYGSTPLGVFVVKSGSKLVNPQWKNPRTGEPFLADDPRNPIGERWIGLEGADETTRPLNGYGIHGTIDPGSIGKEMSMGCIRLLADDVNVIYELLGEGVSIVRIVE